MLENSHVNISVWPQVKSKIVQFVQNERGWFNSNDVRSFIKGTLNLDVDNSSIRNFMKEQLNLSFKRVSSRIVVQDQNWIDAYKIIFWIEFPHIMGAHQVIVNVDEVLLSNSTKTNYSWASKGKTKIVQNISFKGSQALIGAITSIGGWFIFRMNYHNNSYVFIDYIENLVE